MNRSTTHRLSLITGLTLAVLASTALLAHAQYTAYDLGPGGAYGINSAGTVVGWDSSTDHAYSYSGGVRTGLGTLGGSSSWAYSINSSGTIVGESYISGGASHAFSYSGGHMTDLGTLGGFDSSYAARINTAGTIIGASYHSSGGSRPFSYSGGVMTDLGSLGGSLNVASGINSVGTIVGVSSTSDEVQHAFLYSGGVMTDLWAGSAIAINNSGTIVGYNASFNHAYSYSGGIMTDLGTFGGAWSDAYDINSAGDIVGYGNTSDGAQHAFLYRDGQMTDLAPYLASIGLTGNSYAEAIDDNGNIVGFVEDSDIDRAFLLAVIPEPSSVALLALGGAALLLRRRMTA